MQCENKVVIKLESLQKECHIKTDENGKHAPVVRVSIHVKTAKINLVD